MAETIKSFVDKLQSDGVQAGQQEAEKIRSQAQQEADKIIADAKQQAKSIVDDANTEAEKKQQRTQTELELAARDAVNKLQDALNKGIGSVISMAVEEKLNDTEFVGRLLHDIVMQYASSDCQGQPEMTINVNKEMREKLIHWAIETLHDKEHAKARITDLKGTLNQAGFEYSVSGGNVEVTVDSTVDTLNELVRPEIREILNKAMKSGENEDQGEDK